VDNFAEQIALDFKSRPKCRRFCTEILYLRSNKRLLNKTKLISCKNGNPVDLSSRKPGPVHPEITDWKICSSVSPEGMAFLHIAIASTLRGTAI
jgi:hypothetical protein